MIADILWEATKGAAVGGIIGYATNQLAVWMLFHPRAEKRFLGMRVPLTPGLVVKNKDRIAESIGKSVGNDLLDTATLADYLRRVDLATPIHRILMNEYRALSERRETLTNVLGLKHAENLADIRGTIVKDLHRKLVALSSEYFEEEAADNPIVATIERELLDIPLGRMIPEDKVAPVAAMIGDRLAGFLASESGASLVSRPIEDMVHNLPNSPVLGELEDFLGAALRPYIPKLAVDIQESILAYIASEDFERQAAGPLSERLYMLITEKFPMAKMFVTREVIGNLLSQRWPDVVEEIQKVVRKDELKIYMTTRVETGIGELGSTLGESLAREDVQERLIAMLTKEARVIMSSMMKKNDLQRGLSSVIAENRERTVRDFLGNNDAWLRSMIFDVLRKVPEWLDSDAGREWSERTIGGIIDHALLEKPVGELVGFLPEKDWDSMTGALARLFEDRAHRVLPQVLEEQVDLAGLVTEKIRDFDPQRIEEAITRVSGRELSGIVRLGGLIGILVGAVTQVVFFLLR